MMTAEQMKKYVEADVIDWYKKTKEPMPLRILAQRYGKVAAVYDSRLSDVIADISSLEMKATRKGQRLLVPRALLAQDSNNDDLKVYQYWTSFGAIT
jgi:hypothetical protein